MTQAKDDTEPNIKTEGQLLEYLALSIIDVPTLLRRKYIAQRIATTVGRWIRRKLAPTNGTCYPHDQAVHEVVHRAALNEILDLLDGGAA